MYIVLETLFCFTLILIAGEQTSFGSSFSLRRTSIWLKGKVRARDRSLPQFVTIFALYPPDSIGWILWITHEYASAAAVCRDFLVAPLKAKILYVDIMQEIFIVGMGR